VVVASGACDVVFAFGAGDVVSDDEVADEGPVFASARGTGATPLSSQFWGVC
jgi:hypothetical protein